MKKNSATYHDWKNIDYNPVVRSFLPTKLLDYLIPGDSVLDLGCNKGEDALFLASLNFHVTGIDVNESAIRSAKRTAQEKNLTNLYFMSGDIFSINLNHKYNAVIINRVLTCLTSYEERMKLCNIAFDHLIPDGYVLITDFLLSRGYKKRYLSFQNINPYSTWGDFEVLNNDGSRNFIAHHNSEKEVKDYTRIFNKIQTNRFFSKSMNGNIVRMFEFIGQKTFS